MKKWRIEHYRKANGDVPVAKFLEGLQQKMKAKADREINLLGEFGNALREPYSKAMQDGIFELRIKTSSNISRIFYFFFVEHKIILTNGFIKKTQKTPRGEIAKALKYKKD
jgi:phage-related protein